MKFSRMPDDLCNLYSKLKSEKKQKYGQFHKGLFHIHTPASHDYRLLAQVNENTNYKYELSEQAVFDECRKLNEAFATCYTDVRQIGLLPGCETRLETLAYVCLALTIVNEKIEYVVVTDHNVVSGYPKLEAAIEFIFQNQKAVRPCVIAGIEISCADRNHVVVIFDKSNSQAVSGMSAWIDENIMSAETGSYRTSYDVLMHFSGDSFISYIAHINTSDTFNKGFFSGGYKEKLFRIRDRCIVGISDITKQDFIRTRVAEYADNREVYFLLDNDAHCIDGIPCKVTYVKGVKPDFDSLKSAIIDYDTCIEFESKPVPQRYIEGIIVIPGANGFLCASSTQTSEPLILSFSPAMNCLIGGRGTGKSTVINCFNVLLGGRYDSKEGLEAVCNHQEIVIVVHYDDKEYLIDFIQPESSYTGEPVLSVLRRAARESRYRTHAGYFDQYDDVIGYIGKYCVNIFEIRNNQSIVEWAEVGSTVKKSVLDSVFHQTYSISNIMTQISNNRVSDFIMDIFCQTPVAAKLCAPKSVNPCKTLVKTIQKVQNVAQEREQEIDKLLVSFNASVTNLQIVRRPDGNIATYVDLLLPKLSEEIDEYIGFYNITYGDFAEYLSEVIKKLGIVQTISAIVNAEYAQLIRCESLLNYTHKRSLKDVEDGIVEIKYETQVSAMVELCRMWKQGHTSKVLNECLEVYLRHQLRFDLQFDLQASNGSANRHHDYRSVSSLSLGQKVVAILTFILAYGKQIGDSTPLVIDQPEDNLDSQYIYSTLVDSLKRVKDERQVIIATHNSTLVTNTKTEQVIVLNSDHGHGWVECTGYPTSPQIVRKILQYLEGGRDSFIHRKRVYHEEL